jgi:hypothetical protein
MLQVDTDFSVNFAASAFRVEEMRSKLTLKWLREKV